MKWRWARIWSASSWPEQVDNPQLKPSQQRVATGLKISIINHATALIQMNGMNILADPIYADRTSPISFMGPKRVVKPGIKFEDLPPIDLVMISHNHYDHLDIPTLKNLESRDNPKFLVGLGNGRLLAGEGIHNFQEMDWWEELQFKSLKITFVPAQHWSARGLFDRNETLWGGYFVKGDKSVYFAGDTGYGKFFKLIRGKLGAPQVALLPIGAYEPRWFMRAQHLNPEDAVIAYRDLEAENAIGIHFGTFANLTDEPIDQPAKDLAKALEKLKISNGYFIVPEFGKEYSY